MVTTRLTNIPSFNELINNTPFMKPLRLNKVGYSTVEGNKYSIIKYDKTFLNNDLVPTLGLCRSVILNSANRVVCYSPPKSLMLDIFREKYPDNNNNNNNDNTLIAEEFIDGSMINVFWDDKIGLTGGWEIATRNTVSANTRFFVEPLNPLKNKTFREYFVDALNECNLKLDKLNKNCCYSFVLQHPEYRIVVPITHPKLYLVAVYSIVYKKEPTTGQDVLAEPGAEPGTEPETTETTEAIDVITHDINEVKKYDWDGVMIHFPESIPFTCYEQLKAEYASGNTRYYVKGVVIKNTQTGERTKIRNPIYEEIKNLRGNSIHKLQYQYLCLRRQGKVTDYLKYYPEDKNTFTLYKKQLHTFTTTLLSNYIDCYIRKNNALKNYNPNFRTHMYNIHQQYMNELRHKKGYVNKSYVITYVNNLDVPLLMYTLNWDYRNTIYDDKKNKSIVLL